MHDDFYQMYLEEIKEVPACTPAEQQELLEKLLAGDTEVKKRLIEGNLLKALNKAKEYDGKGVLLTDLVQEANMALLLAVESYAKGGGDGDFDEILNASVTAALQQAVMEQEDAGRTEEEITARVNVLSQVAAVMAKELDREATVWELAAKMKMTEEEVAFIMKMAMDAISLNAENADMDVLSEVQEMELLERFGQAEEEDLI